MKQLLAIASAAALIATPAYAAPCRNAQGKFVKCVKTAPAKAKRCKDAKGKFTKCPA